MNSRIDVIPIKSFEADFEFVERKGKGHPDSLADGLAEYLSANYSNYTLEKFGAILHHNFDKVGLLGGSSHVTFGKGYITSPIRVLINGRVSTKFGETIISHKELIYKWVDDFFEKELPLVDVNKDLQIHYNISNQSSPGKTDESKSENGTRKYWFEPRDLNDIQELKALVSNDTSLGVGYAPLSNLEKIVMEIESTLNSTEYHEENRWIGYDIKIMGTRRYDDYDITICIPQIANFVSSEKEYRDNLEKARKKIHEICLKYPGQLRSLNINTRDNFETCELYLTATGSSIESGDEGLVGRGNRINGLISPMKPMSMEGACGKNPVYHIGKIYYLVANEIAQKIYDTFGVFNQVFLVSQSGRDLCDPWITVVGISNDCDRVEEIRSFVNDELKNMPTITNRIINNKCALY